MYFTHGYAQKKQGGNQACNLLGLPTRSPRAGRRLRDLQHFAMFSPRCNWPETLKHTIFTFPFLHLDEGQRRVSVLFGDD